MLELAGLVGVLMSGTVAAALMGSDDKTEDSDEARRDDSEDAPAPETAKGDLLIDFDDDDLERPPEWEYLPRDPWDGPESEVDPVPEGGPHSSDDERLLPPFLRQGEGPDPVGSDPAAPHEDDLERPPEWEYLPRDPWDGPDSEVDPVPEGGPHSSDDERLLPPFLRQGEEHDPVAPAGQAEDDTPEPAPEALLAPQAGAALDGVDSATGQLRVSYDPQDHPDPQLSVVQGPGEGTQIMLDGGLVALLDDGAALEAHDLKLVARSAASSPA